MRLNLKKIIFCCKTTKGQVHMNDCFKIYQREIINAWGNTNFRFSDRYSVMWNKKHSELSHIPLNKNK